MSTKKNKTCFKLFHDWIEADADDEYTYTVCRKCGTYWDYYDLYWFQKILFHIDERHQWRAYTKWTNQNWEPPF